jgi:hypothetical protein
MIVGPTANFRVELIDQIGGKSNRKLNPKAFYEKLRGPLRDLGIELSPKPDNYRKQIAATLSCRSGKARTP